MAINLPITTKLDPRGLNDAESGLSKLNSSVSGFAKASAVAFAAVAVGAAAFGVASIKAAAESEAVTRGLENAVKNAKLYGETATEIDKVTKSFDDASKKLGELSGIDDETINGIKTAWLAVPAIAGMGVKGINDLALTAANVAAGTGKDIETVANTFSKAFENPETALSKLARAGIFLSDTQTALYNQLVATGDAAGAQQLLIDSLGTAYAGAAEAAANPFDRLKVIFENLMETVGTALMPAIQQIVPIIADFVNNLSADPAFQEFLTQLSIAFGELMNALMPLMPTILGLVTTILPPLANLFGQLTPIIAQLVAAFAPLVERVFAMLGPLLEMLMPTFQMLIDQVIMPLAPLVSTLIDAFMPLIEAVLPPLMQIIQTLMPVITSLIEAFSPLIELILPILTSLLQVVMPIIQLFADLLAGPLKFGIDLISGVLKLLTGDFDGAFESFQDAFNGMKDFGTTIINDIIGIFEGMINFIIDGFNGMIEFVNSLKIDVPDWVPLIGGQTLSLNIPTLSKVSIPRLADGGIVMPDPGGSLVNVAEAGKPEAIIPLDRLGGMGTTNNYYVTVSGGLDTGVQIGERVVSAIKRYERSNGQVFASA